MDFNELFNQLKDNRLRFDEALKTGSVAVKHKWSENG